VEDDRYSNKEAEENDLDNETHNNNIFSELQLARSLGTGHYCTT
jgi:hypothetical protein